MYEGREQRAITIFQFSPQTLPSPPDVFKIESKEIKGGWGGGGEGWERSQG